MKIKYAFICGTGGLPYVVAEEAIKKNLSFIVVGIVGVSSRKFINSYPGFWFYIGEIGKLYKSLELYNITNLVIVGAVSRPSLFSLKADNVGREIISRYKGGGDSSLLSFILKEFENAGYIVDAAQSIAPNILAKRGYYSNKLVPEHLIEPIANGFELAKKIGDLDIGQSIIIQDNIVVAVEGIEGSAKLIKRSKFLLKDKGRDSILVKVKKNSQDERVDLPSIGDLTVKQAYSVKLKGIIIEADATILLNEEKVRTLADNYGIFVKAI